jgi:hypothetical protein
VTANLLGTQKVILIKALEMTSVSIGPPLLGNMKGRSFLGAFEKREKFFIRGNFYDKFERDVKNFQQTESCTNRGPDEKELNGFVFRNFLREKENAYMDSNSWAHRKLRVESGGHLEL